MKRTLFIAGYTLATLNGCGPEGGGRIYYGAGAPAIVAVATSMPTSVASAGVSLTPGTISGVATGIAFAVRASMSAYFSANPSQTLNGTLPTGTPVSVTFTYNAGPATVFEGIAATTQQNATKTIESGNTVSQDTQIFFRAAGDGRYLGWEDADSSAYAVAQSYMGDPVSAQIGTSGSYETDTVYADARKQSVTSSYAVQWEMLPDAAANDGKHALYCREIITIPSGGKSASSTVYQCFHLDTAGNVTKRFDDINSAAGAYALN